MLLKLWKKQFWQHSWEQQQEDKFLLSALQWDKTCNDFVRNINPMEISRVMDCCAQDALVVCCLAENQHTLQSVGSQSDLQSRQPPKLFIRAGLVQHHQHVYCTNSTVPVPLLPPTLAERQNPHLKNSFLSKLHDLLLSKARKGFLKMYLVWWTSKGNSTFKVLVGAQPVPSIECSLNKLKRKQKRRHTYYTEQLLGKLPLSEIFSENIRK